METSLVELTHKIDVLSLQVAYLSEQAQIAERQRQERAELMHDLTPIADQAYHLVVEQLEEVQEYIDLNDLLRLIKRLMRNGRNLETMLDQLESLMDLTSTMAPLADEAFKKIMDMLANLEQKGYFNFVRGGMQIADNIVTSFDEEDIARLGDNVVLILNTVKDMTQPEILNFVRNSLVMAGQEVEKSVDSSIGGLLRLMSDPDVRRGLALTMRMLKGIGATDTESGN